MQPFSVHSSRSPASTPRRRASVLDEFQLRGPPHFRGPHVVSRERRIRMMIAHQNMPQSDDTRRRRGSTRRPSPIGPTRQLAYCRGSSFFWVSEGLPGTLEVPGVLGGVAGVVDGGVFSAGRLAWNRTPYQVSGRHLVASPPRANRVQRPIGHAYPPLATSPAAG